MSYYRKLIGVRFSGRSGLSVPQYAETSAHHLFPVLVDNRNAVREALKRRGIGTAIHYRPVTWHRDFADIDSDAYPNAEAWGHNEMTLPLFPAMGEDDVERVVSCLADSMEEVSDV